MSDAFLDQTVRVPNGVLVQHVSGEAVLLNLKTEHYYGLDNIATRMWEVLTSTPSIRDALAQLLAEYEVDELTLCHDLEMLVSKLTQNGLLEIKDTQ